MHQRLAPESQQAAAARPTPSPKPWLQGLLHSDLTANNILLQSVGGPPVDLTGAFEVPPDSDFSVDLSRMYLISISSCIQVCTLAVRANDSLNGGPQPNRMD
jgi:hypothetical protein